MDERITETIEALTDAVALLDRARVDDLSRHLAAQLRRAEASLPLQQAKPLLGMLRRKRFFAPMQRVAEALILSGQDAAVVRRQYAQALIDQGALTAAAAVLREIAVDPEERNEARGLLGRVYKQRYVDSAPCDRSAQGAAARHNADALYDATRSYHEAYLEAPADNYWHGINAVACALRARRDGLPADVVPDPQAVARDVLARIKDAGDNAGAWQHATALEALVALGDDDAGLGRAVRYTQHADADAFEIASTLRQLEEVWCLSSTQGIGQVLLPVLRGALLQRETGAITVTPDEVRHDVRRPTLEKVLGSDAFVSYETYQKGVSRARTIARIGKELGGRGEGTGFLVRGSDLSDRFADRDWLLLTNAHVISNREEHAPAVFPEDAVVTFQALPPDGQNSPRVYEVDEVLRVSGPAELDFAVVKLKGNIDGVTDDDHCDVARRLPVNNQKGRVYIIGHPAGGSLSYSLNDNLLLDYDERLLHYRTPTEGGSSGSPVYNAQWQLIGLHHAGSRDMPRLRGQTGSYEANEGIWIQAIRAALAS